MKTITLRPEQLHDGLLMTRESTIGDECGCAIGHMLLAEGYPLSILRGTSGITSAKNRAVSAPSR